MGDNRSKDFYGDNEHINVRDSQMYFKGRSTKWITLDILIQSPTDLIT